MPLAPRHRRGLIVAGGALVLLAVLIVAPGFVDWTPYRDTFARQLSASIGRPVSIEGNVTFVLVPRPAIEAGRVRIEDGPDAVTIAGVQARLAFLPLLTGDLHFRDLQLDDPVGAMTADLPWNEKTSPAEPGSRTGGTRTVTATIDRIAFRGGDLTLRGSNGGTLLRAQGMDLAITVEGRDRYRLDGDLTLNDEPMTVDARLGAQGGDGIRALSLSARIPSGRSDIAANGRLSLAQRRFDGEVSLKADQGTAFAAMLGLTYGQAPALARPLTFAARMSADETGFGFTGASLDAGGTAAKGTLEWRRERKPQLIVQLDFAPFAIEDWRRPSPPAAAATPAAAAPQMPAPDKGPSDFTAEFGLRFPALSFRGQGLRDGNVTASFARGELTVSDLSVTLPGAARLKAFGLVALGQPAPALEGVVSLQTFDARGLFAWLGANLTDVPAGRLSSASLQGALQGTLNILELNDIEGTLDTARIGGRLSFAPRTRPFVGIDLRLDNVNLDSYRGTSLAPASPSAAQPVAAKPDVYGITPSGSAFAGLGAFDAEVHVRSDGVTAGGLPGGRVGLDLGLKDGKLEIRTASFERIAGTTAWFSGAISGFGTALQFDNLQFDVAGEDLKRLADLFEIDHAASLAPLGAASLTGTLNGSAVQADASATLKIAGLTARANGQIMDVEKSARFNGEIEAAHPRFSELMRATPLSWPANMRDPGALAFRARMAQDLGKTTLSEVRASVGKDRFSASAEISRAEGKTRVLANVTDVLLDLDRLLPPAPGAPAAAPQKTLASAPRPASPWPQDEITWAFLNGWSGEISVAGPAFSARGFSAQDFSGRIVVAEGAAELADWQGKIFGAPGEFSFHIAASPEPTLSAQVAVNRADYRALIAALSGGQTNLKSSGTADLTLSFSTRGTSAAAFAGALSGGGALKVTASETGGGLTAGLLGPLNAAAQLDVSSPGNPAPITFSTRLVAANGIVTLMDADIASRSHTGRFTGAIDLPRRQVDLSGVLVPRKPGEAQLPISIRGAMDRPNIRLLPPPKG